MDAFPPFIQDLHISGLSINGLSSTVSFSIQVLPFYPHNHFHLIGVTANDGVIALKDRQVAVSRFTISDIISVPIFHIYMLSESLPHDFLNQISLSHSLLYINNDITWEFSTRKQKEFKRMDQPYLECFMSRG